MKVKEFQVWEKPLNHLNFKATVATSVYQIGGADQPACRFDSHHSVARKSIGSIMSTSSGFLKEMNKVSNEFAGALAEKILAELQSKVGQ